MAAIELEKICKRFVPGRPVLDSLSLEVASGEMFFLLGPSGCGKSTLLRILAGLQEADSGTIRFDGIDVTALPPEKRQAAMVFQNYALWPHLSVFENVAFGLKILGVKGADLRRQTLAALDTVHLADLADRGVPSLSGGQQQRVALARALAVKPAVLLLDEPLSNLDARLRDDMRTEISRICRERRQTAVYVTHDRQEALSMADRMAVLKDGRIRQQGTPRDLYERPIDRFCGSFLGDLNVFTGRIAAGEIETAFGRFPLTGTWPGARCAAIRPERIRFVPDGTEGAFSAVIRGGSFGGDRTQWVCEAGGVEFQVTEAASPERRPGDRVTLKFVPGYLLAME